MQKPKNFHILTLMDDKYTDEELVRQYLDNESELILNKLFDRYHLHVVFACYKYLENKEDSEDLAMELFASLPERLKKHKITHFRNWLYSVIRNECLMRLRKKDLPTITLDEADVEGPEFVEKIEFVHPNSKRTERLQWIAEALDTLEGEIRICVALFYGDNKTYTKISEITGWDVRHIKNCLQTARRQIKSFIEGKDKQHENVLE